MKESVAILAMASLLTLGQAQGRDATITHERYYHQPKPVKSRHHEKHEYHKHQQHPKHHPRHQHHKEHPVKVHHVHHYQPPRPVHHVVYHDVDHQSPVEVFLSLLLDNAFYTHHHKHHRHSPFAPYKDAVCRVRYHGNKFIGKTDGHGHCIVQKGHKKVVFW